MDMTESLDTNREVSMVSGINYGQAERHRHIKRYLARTQCLLVLADAHLHTHVYGAVLVLPFLLSRTRDGQVL